MAARNVASVMQTPRTSKASLLPRLEGLALFTAALAFYASQGFGWWLFALLLLAPDLAALGYLINARTGNLSYNITHTVIFPLVLAVGVALTGNMFGLQITLIWLAHIGMDRTVGYGLKEIDASLPNKQSGR